VDSKIQRFLAERPAALTVFASAACFAVYFCMYAFRKPFSAVDDWGATVDLTWTGLAALAEPLTYKTLFVISQVGGYCASKFLGIKVVSELSPAKRALAIVVCIAVAEAALLLFGVIPAPYNAMALFLNGLPLGMVWGLVFGFVEGRRTSDLIGTVLCISFIVASGAVKSVGGWLLNLGVDPYWMPALTGAVFAVPLLVSVFGLSQVPAPSAEDVAARSERVPMDKAARRAFFFRFAPGLGALVLGYVLLTVGRTIRDDFASNIWAELGFKSAPEIMTLSELPVALGATLAVALIFLFKSDRRALLAVHGLLLAGGGLVGLATLGFVLGVVPATWWMILVGLGFYVAYVPVNCVLFDRMIGAVGVAATAGFLIYVADAFGYLGYVALLLYKDFGNLSQVSWVEFFTLFCWVAAAGTLVLFGLSAAYFAKQGKAAEAAKVTT
jgi:hypothetical protein